MSYPAFISAVFILLLSPGPTNTLMGLASARNSFGLVLRLLPADLLGYLTMILPLTWLGGELISRWPETALVLKAAAAIWIMYLAIKLWVAGSKDVMNRSVTARRIFVTTTRPLCSDLFFYLRRSRRTSCQSLQFSLPWRASLP